MSEKDLVIQLNVAGLISPKAVEAIETFGRELEAAVAKAKCAEIPQGMIIGMIHALDVRETSLILKGRN